MKNVNTFLAMLVTVVAIAFSSNQAFSASFYCAKKASKCRLEIDVQRCNVTYFTKGNKKEGGARVQVEGLAGAGFFGNGAYIGGRADAKWRWGTTRKATSKDRACSTVTRGYSIKPGCTLYWWAQKSNWKNPYGHNQGCPKPKKNRGKKQNGKWR